MDLKEHYTQQRDACQTRIRQLQHRSHAFLAGEIGSFALMLVAIGGAATASDMLQSIFIAVAVVAYVVIRRADSRNDERVHHEEDVQAVYQHELQALSGDFSCFDSGQRYADPHHPYSFDLDLFGPDSVYQRFCRTATTGGSDALAKRLSSPSPEGSSSPSPSEGGDVDYRKLPTAVRLSTPHQAIDVLAEDEAFRTQFISYGVRQKIDTTAIREALAEARSLTVPAWYGKLVADLLVGGFTGGLVTCTYLAVAESLSGYIPLWWATVQFFAVYLLTRNHLSRITAALGRLHDQLRQLIHLVQLMQQKPVPAFTHLDLLLDELDARGNMLGLFIGDTVFLNDIRTISRFLRWRDRDAAEVEAWLDRVIQRDQDVTIATLRFNHPETTWPTFTDEAGVHVDARGLWHPFLGDRAVRNDFLIDDRNFYIITGANMAGKSTFLRAIGVNVVLARAGMPVFAERLVLSRFRLFSSMRTTDDLTHGISYFNAELLRLKQLITSLTPLPPPLLGGGESPTEPLPGDATSPSQKGKGLGDEASSPSQKGKGLEDEASKGLGDEASSSLIILDEILRGTNSADKLNGSRMFLEYIAQRNVSGIIATHDLELSKMEGPQFHNYCFEIELGNRVTYSYRITPGVARNQNATFLLREMLSQQG